tara:strand:+ start:56 stop:421 length:366 start_codon:yes stop_codon:yes gene_type:complete
MFRRRSNGRGFRRQNNDNEGKRLISGTFSNNRGKNNFKSHQSVEKLLERYKILAKEAFSSGDKILSENYLQHADHFERIISHRNLNQNENSSQVASATKEQNNNSSNTSEINQDHITKSKE